MAETDEPTVEIDEFVGVLGEEVASGERRRLQRGRLGEDEVG
jgi:hypothetical protein